MNRFLSSFDDLLLKLAGKRHESYIFTDSNIDLLKIENNATVQAYLDSIFSQGFLQFNFKATRIQGNAHSLIDHIMSNTTSTTVETCVLVTDISDHFPTLFTLGKQTGKIKHKTVQTQIFLRTTY